jgi:hypothetical protein
VDEERPRPIYVTREAALPPPPPGVRYVSVPFGGIVIADDDLRDHVENLVHWPMIVLALAVLPLLAIEIWRSPTGPLQWAIDIAFGIIWLAFVVEFVIKIAIAEDRIEYVRRNWLDLVIIALPLLRPLRAFRATRGIARTTRIFRLRGVGMKCARYIFTIVIGLEATDRLLARVGLKAQDRRKDPAHMTRYELVREIKQLRRRTDAWEAWHDAHDTYVQQHHGACYIAPRPKIDEPADEPEVRLQG